MATKVLIIDDDQDILESTGIILSSEGFEVHTADSVEQGMQMIESIGPDVILLDIVFPESVTGGFEAAHTIKARYPRLPIIAFSAVSREYALAFGQDQIEADEFLSKPVQADALVEIIRRRLS